MFDDWPWWATLGLALLFGYVAFWGLRAPHPNSGKTCWERRLSELQALAEHLTAVNRREALQHPKHIVTLREVSAQLAKKGILHPRSDRLSSDDLYEWEVYMWNLIDRVKRGKARNLHPLYREVRQAIAEKRAAQDRFDQKLFGK